MLGPRNKTLVRHGAQPLKLDRGRAYDQSSRVDKPTGLWVSCRGADDWESWCRAEDYGDLTCCDRITLASDANILWVDNAPDVRGLSARYPSPITYMPARYSVDWQRVADEYDGIIIPTYQWSCRYDDDCAWYYGWDCASGCIWNLGAVADVTPDEGRGGSGYRLAVSGAGS